MALSYEELFSWKTANLNFLKFVAITLSERYVTPFDLDADFNN